MFVRFFVECDHRILLIGIIEFDGGPCDIVDLLATFGEKLESVVDGAIGYFRPRQVCNDPPPDRSEGWPLFVICFAYPSADAPTACASLSLVWRLSIHVGLRDVSPALVASARRRSNYWVHFTPSARRLPDVAG